ncbi:MAG: glycosyltransferase family 25 protein [Holosporaceae bacterium]|jgi:hypothetical protein|nr:glycosyltransferase family 25 protein [Holosporaceae bacterium]
MKILDVFRSSLSLSRFILSAFFFFFSATFTLDYDDAAVYVINLDRSPDRMKKMEKQLKKLGVKFRRFKAIDGLKDITIVNGATGKFDSESFSFFGIFTLVFYL